MTGCPAGLFVAGTDTGVGKTVATAALLSLFRARRMDAVPMKPIQTGCGRSAGNLASPDLEFCLRMLGLHVGAEEEERMCPYRYEPACSPHLAAALGGDRICIESIGDCFDALHSTHDCVVVEGAGGVLVPINDRQTMLDVMIHLGLPVLLVSRPGLGTLNHTLLSLKELRRAGLKVQGVLFCETCPTEWGRVEQDNWQTIEQRGDVPIWGKMPYISGLDSGTVTPAEFHDIISESITWIE
ncbi:MAG: dethiobiotin synthase [Pirellulaceae bacterium]